jgi:hypothetical protein
MAAKTNERSILRKPLFAEVRVQRLVFDTENPRLTMDRKGLGDEEMVSLLWREMAVDEIVDSISANGFFREEPLIVIPKTPGKMDPEKDNFVVVEGNRRLAAVRLLLDKGLQQRIGAKDVPSVSETIRDDLQKLPVGIYEKRPYVWAYLGFRHINGPKPWDALGKAMFVARVYEGQGLSLDKIAQQIGDRNITVKRLYRGFTLLRQAEREGSFDRADAIANRFYFSHLYTAADQAEFQKFLGIDSESSLRKDPVPKSKLKQLGELMLWIYGSRENRKEPLVQTQYPDINTLRAVLSVPAGIAALRAGYGLDRSYEIAVGDPQRFREAMVRSRENLVQANGTVVNGYDGESDLLALTDEVLKLASKVAEEVQKVHAQKKQRVRA